MLNREKALKVLELSLQGASYRELKEKIHVGSDVIHRLKLVVSENNLSIEQVASLSDHEYIELFYPQLAEQQAAVVKVLPDFEVIYQKRLKGGKRFSFINQWRQYRDETPPGASYGYTQFKKYFHEWEHVNHPEKFVAMPVLRHPGQYAYLDWVGDTPALVKGTDVNDPLQKVHILVMTVGYSSMTWFAAYPNEKKDKVALGVSEALNFFGAVPQALRPDNMKTAVIKNDGDEIILSDLTKDVSIHYDMEIYPCRPRQPKDKASVERAVQIIEKEFLLPMVQNGEIFESFDELNKNAVQFLAQLNGRRKSGETRSREELYYQYDFPEMKKLPVKKFICYEYTTVTVPSNYHVAFDGHCYSVPFSFVGKTVIVKSSQFDVVICSQDNVEIVRHKRSWETPAPANKYITCIEHMPKRHQIIREEQDPAFQNLEVRAKAIGPFMTKLIQEIMGRELETIQSQKACLSILRSCHGIPSHEAEKAAEMCLVHKDCSKAAFRKALENVQESKSDNPSYSNHENIRGKDCYK